MSKKQRIDELLDSLVETDTLMVTELSCLGCNTAEIIGFINAPVQRNIRVIILKQGMEIRQQDMQLKIMITLF